MTEHDEAIRQYLSLSPRRFAVLEEVEVRQRSTGGAPATELTLELWLRASENEDADSQRLYLSFENVSELKINSRGFFQIPLLEIVSIRDSQWEGLKYRVADTEENQLSFYCRRFDASIKYRDNTSVDQ